VDEERFVSAYSDSYEEDTNRLAKNHDGNGFSWQYVKWLEGKLSEADEKLRLLGKAAKIDVDEKFEDLVALVASTVANKEAAKEVVKTDEPVQAVEAPVSPQEVPAQGQVPEVAKTDVLPGQVPEVGEQPPKAA
jgi:hypothetical protein